MKRKTFTIDIQEMRKDGGKIVINTAALDRDRDRVFPSGAKIENYLENPVVMWGHNYSEPYATAGRTTILSMTPENIEVDFELRPAANEYDPQNIVRLLWEGGWIKTASVGFIPNMATAAMNEEGGWDIRDWELLEWSLVPIPANQEALRLAAKAFTVKTANTDADKQDAPTPEPVDPPTEPELTDEELAIELVARHGETLLDIFREVTQ
jgi:HK97 family phage prohead protease